MIRTYLRLDLFKGENYFDDVDLGINENVLDVLQGMDDADYAELILVTEFGSHREDGLVAFFRRARLKGNKDYQWILTMDRFVK